MPATFVALVLAMILAEGGVRAQTTATESWIESLPTDLQASILWQADHEEGNLTDWEPIGTKEPGGGVLNTREDAVTAVATTVQAHSGRYSAQATITGALRGWRGSRAVRLMRWTNRPWDKGGHEFPRQAYYSTWMYFPRRYNSNKYPPWDPGDGGWWNVFQFKANDDDDVSQPVWALNVGHDDDARAMEFYLYSSLNRPASIDQDEPIPLPIGRWFHVEAFYRVSAGSGGEIIVWQDGHQILHGKDVRTAVSKANENAVWGIGNYTDHIAGEPKEGRSTIFFDDAIVSARRISKSFSR